MKIAVGLSGGVDSAVTALLCKREGHEVLGSLRKYGIPGLPFRRNLLFEMPVLARVKRRIFWTHRESAKPSISHGS